MRTHFSWEPGLSQSTFERALLLLGLLPPSSGRHLALPAPPELGFALAGRWQRLGGGLWSWRLRPSTERLLDGPEAARRLAAAAEILLRETRRDTLDNGPGLRLEATVPADLDGVALLSALRAAGADSVFLRLRDEGETAWDWPLRIAESPGSELLGGIAEGSSLRRLFYGYYSTETAAVRLNLLLWENSLAAAVRQAASGARLSTDAAVLFGGLGASAGSAPALVARLRELTDAQGVFVFDRPRAGVAQAVVERLIRELSHGLALDSAIGKLADLNGLAVLSWSTRRLVLAASVREQGRVIAKRLQQMRGSRVRVSPAVRKAMKEANVRREIPPPAVLKKIFVGNLPFSASDDEIRTMFGEYGTVESVDLITDRDSGRPRGFGFVEMSDGADEAIRALHRKELGGGTLTVKEARPRTAFPPVTRSFPGDSLGVELDAPDNWSRAEELGLELELGIPFDAESGGASAIADLADAVAAAIDVRGDGRPERYLQARVETPSGRAVEGGRPLRPARDYRACVLIGARRRQWLGLTEPVDVPQPRPDGQPLTLQVMFWEPRICPEPQLQPLQLFPTGDTGVATFPFHTAGPGELSARIAVYHRNRNLQTGLLRGVVGNEPSALSFTLDATPQPRFTGLADRGVIGASIVVNDDPGGGMRAFTYRDGEVGVADLSEPRSAAINPGSSLDGLTQAISRSLARITRQPAEYTDLSKQGSRGLLLELAQHGSALLTRLRKHDRLDESFDDIDHVQIVRAHVDAFFPAEFLYSGEPPEDDATICDGLAAARQALLAGRCCGAYDGDPKHTICPLRFWSTSKVIERHAHRPEHARMAAEFELRRVPVGHRQRVLDPLAGAILAASDRADTAVADTVETLRGELDKLVRKRPVATVSDWESWAAEIDRSQPHLLVLLPHHEQRGGFDLLEIGAGQTRKSMQIRAEHVCPQGVSTSPVVLLIGCETESAKVDLESFVPAFQDAGAAIVVSTIASILGRHAGPATAVVVEELARIQGDDGATFGQAMLAARRRLLAAGTPMVLGLTSYGDADWRIVAASGEPP